MFDIGGVELLIIAVVAIIVVGPKDLPGMLRRIGKMVAKARGMASEFKSHFDDIADQEELKEFRKGIESVQDLSPANQIKQAMSPFEEAGSTIRDTIDSGTISAPAKTKSSGKKKSPAKSKKTKSSTVSKPAKVKSSPKKARAKASAKLSEKASA